jgi:hypothetical protein
MEVIRLLLLVFDYAQIGVIFFALIDASFRPDAAFRATGRPRKLFWVGALVVALVLKFWQNGQPLSIFSLAAFIFAVIYLLDVRPKVRDAEV